MRQIHAQIREKLNNYFIYNNWSNVPFHLTSFRSVCKIQPPVYYMLTILLFVNCISEHIRIQLEAAGVYRVCAQQQSNGGRQVTIEEFCLC